MSDRTVNAAAVRARRQDLYPSLAAFCEAAGVSPSHMKRIEAGTHQPARRWTALQIAKALSWDVEQLYATAQGSAEDAA